MANVEAPAVFQALGDATRRAIIERLSSGPAPVGQIAAPLPVSRSAVSQHLRILRDAHLVIETALGARRLYQLDPRGLSIARHWLDQHWSTTISAFARHANKKGNQA